MVPIESFFFFIGSNYGIFKVELEVIRKSMLGLAGYRQLESNSSRWPKGHTRWGVGRLRRRE